MFSTIFVFYNTKIIHRFLDILVPESIFFLISTTRSVILNYLLQQKINYTQKCTKISILNTSLSSVRLAKAMASVRYEYVHYFTHHMSNFS